MLVNAAGSTKTPVLSAEVGSEPGELTLTTDIGWGTNATGCQLFENEKLVDSQELEVVTPAAQRVVTVLSDREPGIYEYLVILGNDAGESNSKIRSVRVKQQNVGTHPW